MDPFQPSLFAAESSFPRDELKASIRRLADRGVFFGTSSWRYEGWLGQFYTPERYFTRGRFSKTKFHDECLQEYAEVFPVVGGDFTFYAAPTPEFWKKTFDQAPRQLKWSLKAPEDFTRKRFPTHPRYGPRAGLMNPGFLDPAAFEAIFLDPLGMYADRISAIILEFGAFSKEEYPTSQAFADDLNAFLAKLPRSVAYSVEIRNPDFLCPEYFEVLRANGAAHVFNSWSRMPSIFDQIEMPAAFTAPFSLTRALLRPGRTYEQAVSKFSPYSEIRDPYEEGREALRVIVERSIERKRTAYIHVNNRFEGNAIETIRATVG